MIFVTVGTELPFDRLVRAVDDWARENNRTDFFAQIGEGGWEPRFIRFQHFIEPPEFARVLASASVVVSHAGAGIILTALRWEKPLLVMPRRASLGEQRNEHQLATARYLAEMGKVGVALDENELRNKLMHLEEITARPKIGPYASEELRTAIRRFILL
ncbi:MAG: glycosyltransferase [Chthoniobacteraceae bacterium]|jgi:UDP-N-acetylglucosamine transferase subunit ALG13